MDDEHTKEASWVVQSVTGASAYLHGLDYSQAKFKEELDRAVDHIKKTAQKG